MKFKKGDYFIVVADKVNNDHNGKIGMCIGEFNTDGYEYHSKIIVKNDDYYDYNPFPFNVDEVKKLTKEELMLELL